MSNQDYLGLSKLTQPKRSILQNTTQLHTLVHGSDLVVMAEFWHWEHSYGPDMAHILYISEVLG